jgi:MoaA/NifB/PqqE/SkfB family radical SAM enzyme
MNDPLEKMGKLLPRLVGRDFSDEEIEQAMKDRRLLRVNIEIGQNFCPLRCKYCYSNSGERQRRTITFHEITGTIEEGVRLGAKSIILTGGGEPLEEGTRFREIIEHVVGLNAIPVVFTCGTPIADNPEIARFLIDHNVTVITKLNSTDNDPEATNDLSDREWAYDKMRKAIDELMSAGYGMEESAPRLGVESVITWRNYDEIVPLWRWIRDRNLFPYIELTKLMGRAKWTEYAEQNRVDVESARTLFEHVAKTDRDEYNCHWTPIPPIMASQCTCYYCGCYVDMKGHIHPCSGVDADGLGKATDPNGLENAVRSKSFHTRVRSISQHLQGKCGACRLSRLPVGCYGCRAHSYWEKAETDNLFDAYCKEDPLCWIAPAEAEGIANSAR